MKRWSCFLLAAGLLAPADSVAQAFRLPTPNRTLLTGGGENYFVGTVGRPWTSGTFGCVRSGGAQLHEGLDIRCVHRDKAGEATDPVVATAAGKVAYVNRKSSLSNYGIYVILQHRIHGLEIYSTYAHLREARSGLKVGDNVAAGEAIGVMGRTTNTREQISKDRAHLHFELTFFINERFSLWYRKTFPGQRNDHGIWNGQNLVGVDPQKLLLASQHPKFNLLQWVNNQPELCRVLVKDTNFPWLMRYAPLVRRNPVAEKEGVAAYEVALTFNGMPFQIIPRAASEIKTKSKSKYQILSVNEQEWRANACRGIVQKRGSWQLGNNGVRLLDLLTY